jgi:hypothetical protein
MAKFQAKMVQGDGAITAVVDNTPYTISVSHPNYNTLRTALRENDADKFVKNVDIVQAVQTYINTSKVLSGKVTVDSTEVLYNGKPLHNSLSKRILDLVRGGFDVAPLVKFLENLMSNPSARAVNELYTFLDHGHLPITEDGCFIAYKTVRENYLDKYSGKFSNRPGTVLEMPRNEVDDDAQRTCSYGFHVGSLQYSGPGGWYNSSSDRVILVKVNPRDAVSVPADHSAQKLRVSRYEVIGDYKAPLNRPVYSGKGVNDVDYTNDEYIEDKAWSDEEIPVSTCWEDLQEGDEISFDYTKGGVKERRYLRVTDVDFIDDKVTGTLIYPEDNDGEYRSFLEGNMSDIQLLSV